MPAAGLFVGPVFCWVGCAITKKQHQNVGAAMTRLIVSVFIVMGIALSGGVQIPRMTGAVSFISEAEAAPPKPRKPPKSKPAKPPKKKPAFK